MLSYRSANAAWISRGFRKDLFFVLLVPLGRFTCYSRTQRAAVLNIRVCRSTCAARKTISHPFAFNGVPPSFAEPASFPTSACPCPRITTNVFDDQHHKSAFCHSCLRSRRHLHIATVGYLQVAPQPSHASYKLNPYQTPRSNSKDPIKYPVKMQLEYILESIYPRKEEHLKTESEYSEADEEACDKTRWPY